MAYTSKSINVILDSGITTGNSITITNSTNTNTYLRIGGTFQGTVTGYNSGGYPSPTLTRLNIIDKFPFASNANATDVGDLTQSRADVAGQSSTIAGYTSGGDKGPAPTPPGIYTNVIDRFPFASNNNATDAGDLTIIRKDVTGQSSSTHGYTSGGYGLQPFPTIPGQKNEIDRFPFGTVSNATDVGDLSRITRRAAGQSSITHGYTSGGSDPSPASPGISNVIDRFPFSTNANASDVGDLILPRVWASGQSSEISGYTSGGETPPTTNVNTIDKFPFASNSNASDVGDLGSTRSSTAGQSSTVSGYVSGGSSASNTIEKFPFATNSNATDVGDLTVGRNDSAGQQD